MTAKVESEQKRPLDWVVIGLAWGIFVYFMGTVMVLFQTGVEQQTICLALTFTFLGVIKIRESSENWAKIAWIAFILVGLVASLYVKVEYDHLEASVGFPEQRDVVIGILLIACVLIGTWASWGPMFSGLAILAILYFVFGHHLPPPLFHPEIPFDEAVSLMSVGLEGIYSGLLGVVAEFLMLLVIFGSLMEAVGSNSFFMQLGNICGRFLQGGPAHAAVIGSSLVGSTTGAAAANVVVTGSMTIPLMKKMGYRPAMAGGIEAAASTGSQLMPPVMGVAAFLMADFLGVDYVNIMIAGIMPALLYYFGIGLAVQFYAKKMGIVTPRQGIDFSVITRIGPIVLLPIFLLLFLLTQRYSISYTVFYCIFLVLGLAFLRKSTRPSIEALTNAVVKGVTIGAKLAMVLAAVGIIAQTVITTGLGGKITHIIEVVSFGQIWIMLILTAVLCFFIGQGIPTAPAYVLMAILVAPSLVQKGLPVLEVHFFVFYFAVIAAISPPVALASMTAAKIADSRLFETGYNAMKLASAGFILPFLFFTNPSLLLQADTFLHGLTSLATTLVFMSLLTAVLFGYFFTELRPWERLAALIGIGFLFSYLVVEDGLLMVGGAVFSVVFTVSQARHAGWLGVKPRSASVRG